MREVREPYKPVGRVGERKKKRIFSVSPHASIALCFQLRSRPFV